MSSPKPLTISVPQAHIDILQQKLSLTTFPDELEDSAWDLGAPLADIKRLAAAWQKFDWRAAERRLNAYPHFQIPISVDGFGSLDIHFIHKRSANPKSIPLLFVHGWPGHFGEVLKILEPLASPGNSDQPAFHVVAPSLPNFGFSEAPSKRGFAVAQYAETCHKLMKKLGYDTYVSQAGDLGYWITRAMGKLYPESLLASHMNMVLSHDPTRENEPELAEQYEKGEFDDFDRQSLERRKWFRTEGMGYNSMQSTKPQTLSYSLRDSPVALLAWLYEKLHDWSDQYPWTDDEVLEWVSIYQFSRAGPHAAHRFYYEVTHTSDDENGPGKGLTYSRLLDYTPDVKLGLAFNPKEIEPSPVAWGKMLGSVVYEVKNDHGGHFYAHEHPELLVRDMRTMFGKQGGAFGIVEGSNGYD